MLNRVIAFLLSALINAHGAPPPCAHAPLGATRFALAAPPGMHRGAESMRMGPHPHALNAPLGATAFGLASAPEPGRLGLSACARGPTLVRTRASRRMLPPRIS